MSLTQHNAQLMIAREQAHRDDLERLGCLAGIELVHSSRSVRKPMTVSASLLLAAFVTQSGTLHLTAPPAWNPRPSTSPMRVAEFVVPRVAGDPEDAETIVYFFGGSGGSVDANIERWVGQFQTESGGPVPAPKRTTSATGPLTITAIDVSGTYVAQVRPGSAERFNKPNFRMWAGVVETPKGPYFVKLTGPVRTVTQALSNGDFDSFLKSLRFE